MTDEWIRVLGIDYGTVRIGLAVSDDLGMFAHPLKTISGKADDRPAEEIAGIVRERGIREIVIGLPLHADGRESTMSRAVLKFIEILRERLGDEIPIHQVDEWASSKTARHKIESSGRKKKDIEQILDQAAAMEILQGWLDNGRGIT
jgi:putative Holliday junction resolvase